MHWKLKVLFVLLFASITTYAQVSEPDSTTNGRSGPKTDSARVDAFNSLAASFVQSDQAKAINFAERAISLATKIDYKRGVAYGYKWLGISYNFQGKYYEALVNSNKSLTIFESLNDEVGTSNLLSNLGYLYAAQGEESKATEYYLKSLQIAEQHGNKLRIETALTNIGQIYSKNFATNDKALEFYLQALPYAISIDDKESLGIIYTNIGEIYIAENNFPKAHEYFKKGIEAFGKSESIAFTYNDLGKLYKKTNQYDSAYFFYDKAYTIAKTIDASMDMAQSFNGLGQLSMALQKKDEAISYFKKSLEIIGDQDLVPELKEAYEGLAAAYKVKGDYKNALNYSTLLSGLYDQEKKKKLNFTTATLAYSIDLQKQSGEIEKLIKEKKSQEQKLADEKFAKNFSIAGLGAALIIAFILLGNIRHRKKLNTLLHRQKKEIELQKMSVESTLTELKATQSQLIYAEKMASLGELTAGIAHEIQNPLNFVNNFSEINRELITEVKEELVGGNIENIRSIISDIEANETKINHHGQRADAIVKGMLQHSRQSKGVKEPININALCAEYLRLSYHGFQAKDKSFKEEYTTDFDTNIGKINIIPQDIGRVLLNLLNNAFYAVNEKRKTASDEYKPIVSVQTMQQNGKVIIQVSDNGDGIPANVVDKIFQPFFTTKPTGRGTGLGLSLSYDIIKAHNGEIEVSTKEGQGTTFIITLPRE